MGDSVEFHDGVFVATGRHEAVENGGMGPATGTALMVRPDGHLAPVDVPGPLVSAELPPAGPVGPAPTPAPAAGGARRVAVATIVASLIAAVAFGAAAFGGAFGSHSSTPGSGRSALGAAAASSAGATSVAFTVSASRATSSTTTTLVTGSGAVDLAHDTGRLTATVPAVSGIVGGGNDTVNLVADNNSLYVSSPALSSATGDVHWLKVTLPADSAGPDSSTLAVLANPSQLLGLLSSLGGQVTTVGNVDLDGVPTTEYRTTVSVAELASRAGVTAGSTLGNRIAQVLGRMGNTSVPVTAWVGTDGYVRQLSASLDLSRLTLGGLAGDVVNGTLGSSTAGKATTSTTVTVGFSHYNQPVTVTVPPASQVTDANGIVSTVKGAVSDLRHAVSSFASHF